MEYSSQELKIRVEETIKYCEENNLESIIEYLFDDVKETIITSETEVNIYLPEYDDDWLICIEEFLDMIEEIKGAKIIEGYKYISPKRVLVKVDALDKEKLDKMISEFWENFSVEFQFDKQNFLVELTEGPTNYAVLLTKLNDYNEYFPPYSWGDTMIKITSDKIIEENIIENIIEAFIFEVSSSLDIELNISPRSGYDFEKYDYEDVEKYKNIRMRPLLINENIKELLKFFNATNEIFDPEISILYHTKVIEYVSQSVVKKEMLNNILNKLLTSEALSPNANYILELERLFEIHRKNTKDNEAIKLTVQTCCNIDELVKISPLFLKKLKKLTIDSSIEEKKQALNELAKGVSDTRNMIAHAKINYKKKGGECPQVELEAFSKCLKVVASQAIRWFARQGENEKIF